MDAGGVEGAGHRTRSNKVLGRFGTWAIGRPASAPLPVYYTNP